MAALQPAPTPSSAGAQVATIESTGSVSYVQLATTTDAVTVNVQSSGMVMVTISANTYNSTLSTENLMSFVASGNNTIAASDNNACISGDVATSNNQPISRSMIFSGLTPGSTTFKMQYRVSGGSGSFGNRAICVVTL